MVEDLQAGDIRRQRRGQWRVVSFAPTDERGGTYSCEGSLVSGGGSYTIAGDEGGPLTLNYSGNGCAVGGQCAATSAVVTSTPNEEQQGEPFGTVRADASGRRWSQRREGRDGNDSQ